MPNVLKLAAAAALFCERRHADRFKATGARRLSPKTMMPESTARGCCAIEAALPKGIAEMFLRLVDITACARLSSRAKLICWSATLVAACLVYSAWAGPQAERRSTSTPRIDQRATVQLGFLADDEPATAAPPIPRQFGQPVPQPIAPDVVPFEFAAPPSSVPVAPSFPTTSIRNAPMMPRASLPATDDDDSQPQDLAGSWWAVFVTAPLRENSQPLMLSIEEILVRAIHHSSQVRVFSDLPLIRETSIIEADAAFDWTAFLDTRWQGLNDPVGSSLTIGTPGVNRYKNDQYTSQGGVRKRTREGGTLQLSEQLGWQQTNSTFFKPNPQGTSRLVLGR